MEPNKIIDFLTEQETQDFIRIVGKYALESRVYANVPAFVDMLLKVYSVTNNMEHDDVIWIKTIAKKYLGIVAWKEVKDAVNKTDSANRYGVRENNEGQKTETESRVDTIAKFNKDALNDQMTLANEGKYNPEMHYVVPKYILLSLLIREANCELSTEQIKFIHTLTIGQVIEYFKVQYGVCV